MVVGAGGFGRETLDVVESINRSSPAPRFEVLGVVDENPSAENLARLSARGVTYLGTVAAWLGGSALDVDYEDSRSLALDAKILVRTVASVFGHEGISADGHATMHEFGAADGEAR